MVTHLFIRFLGRPVGTTIYPGVQIATCGMKMFIDVVCTCYNFLMLYILGKDKWTIDSMSINDVCCFVPIWAGLIGSIVTGLIAFECTLACNGKYTLLGYLKGRIKKGSKRSIYPSNKRNQGLNTSSYNPAVECGIFAMGMMAMCPTNLMRSMGGGYENESVVMPFMLTTFYFWIRSLRGNDDLSHRFSIHAGISFCATASCWGGYIFVSNLIALHAFILILMGRFTEKLRLSYSMFYVLGTFLATRIPVVGYKPLQSLEQIFGLGVLLLCQLLHQFDNYNSQRNTGGDNRKRVLVRLLTIAMLVGLFAVVNTSPLFTPLSPRIRSIFMKHQPTGNPLIDSVAEHQPADASVYLRFLQNLCIGSPLGMFYILENFGDVPCFLLVYTISAIFLSLRMVRLLILVGPVASILTGIAMGRIVFFFIFKIVDFSWIELEEGDQDPIVPKTYSNDHGKKKKKYSKEKILNKSTSGTCRNNYTYFILYLVALVVVIAFNFLYLYNSIILGRTLTSPAIVERRMHQGQIVTVDDYREAYSWLKTGTPEDSRILAWYDLGFHISSMTDRRSFADGNTWNYEHIALLARILTSSEEEAYSLVRHISDYILVSAGGSNDDLAKIPHIAQIANNVYPHICGKDSDCSGFRLSPSGRPSKLLQTSLLFKLHSNLLIDGVTINQAFFKEVFRSKFGIVRIYKIVDTDEESKLWVDDPRNRFCDAPRSWICRGRYPPTLRNLLSNKISPQSDNVDHSTCSNVDNVSREQTRNPQYMDSSTTTEQRCASRESHQRPGEKDELMQEVTKESIAKISQKWEDTDHSTMMWNIVTRGTVADLEKALENVPLLAHVRSSDGRGPIWWAFEHQKHDMVQVLKQHNVNYNQKDKDGLTPVDLLSLSQNIEWI